MRIEVNDHERIVTEGVTLAELLSQLGLSDKQGIAVAVNEQVIQKKSWSSVALQENDAVLLITATQGG